VVQRDANRQKESPGCIDREATSLAAGIDKVFIIDGRLGYPAKLRNSQMAIPSYLLEILICPACRAKVELKPDGSGLRCVSCHRVYPIRDEIPVMMADEAHVED
jgi:uncharacterized protein YbaR (Trm112 family)